MGLLASSPSSESGTSDLRQNFLAQVFVSQIDIPARLM